MPRTKRTPQTELLSDWAKRNGISLQKAKDMARRGKLRPYVTLKAHAERYFIKKGVELKDLEK